MKVLIDGHMLGKREGGNGRYVENLARELFKKMDGVKVLVDGEHGCDFSKEKLVELRGGDLGRLMGSFLRDFKEQDGLIHSNYVGPFVRRGMSLVLTVHDMGFRRYPDQFSLRERVVLEGLMPISLRRCDRVIVPSNFSKSELLEFYPFAKSKVRVVYEAADEVFKDLGRSELREYVKEKGLEGRFLLFLAGKYKRKRLDLVLRVFESLQARFKDLSLMVVGRGSEKLKRKSVEGLGWVSDEELNKLYNLAEALVYPSVYEGFGLPVFEAMQVGCPVVMADLEVFKELLGKSMGYFKVNDEKGLEEKLKEVLLSEGFRESLKKFGFSVSSRFSWEKMARETVEVYREVIS